MFVPKILQSLFYAHIFMYTADTKKDTPKSVLVIKKLVNVIIQLNNAQIL